MTELKTLKDLETFQIGVRLSGEPENLAVLPVQLKAEAVKWVKDDFQPEGFHARYGFNWNDGIEDWIKHFFNLTEEDLK